MEGPARLNMRLVGTFNINYSCEKLSYLLITVAIVPSTSPP